MARGGRLPPTAGRPPRFLRTGHRRATSLSEAHLQAARRDARHTLGREAEGVLQSLLFHRASRGLRAQKGDIPRPGRGRPRRRRGARFRGGLPAAAEVADAAPATAPRPEEPCCAKVRRCPDCPALAARRARFGVAFAAPPLREQQRRWRPTPEGRVLSLRECGTVAFEPPRADGRVLMGGCESAGRRPRCRRRDARA